MIKMNSIFVVFPAKTTVKAWYCFPISHDNLNMETYSVPAAKNEMLQRQINAKNIENSRVVHETRNKYFITALSCYETKNILK